MKKEKHILNREEINQIYILLNAMQGIQCTQKHHEKMKDI